MRNNQILRVAYGIKGASAVVCLDCKVVEIRDGMLSITTSVDGVVRKLKVEDIRTLKIWERKLMSDNLHVAVCNGKYTVVQGSDYSLKALRHGEEWRDCCGDNLIYWLAVELQEARDEIKNLKAQK